MPSDDDYIRISRLADERLVKMKFSGSDRASAHRVLMAQIESEEDEAATAASVAAEATAERARINAIVTNGRDLGKARQALRLALSGPVTPEQAAAILPTMRSDVDAPDAGTLPTALPTFGSPAEQSERKRIASVFGSQEAAERFNATCSFALLGDAPLTAVVAMLAQLETEFAPQRLLTIEQRAAQLTEAGPDPFSGQRHGMSKQEKIAADWSKAVKAANASIGVPVAEQPAQPVTSVPMPPDAEEPEWVKEARR